MPTITETEVIEDGKGHVLRTVVHQVEISQGEANRRSLLDKAQQALAVNAAFLANASPTNPQVLAQVRMLTREQTAVIRLLILQALDDISDT